MTLSPTEPFTTADDNTTEATDQNDDNTNKPTNRNPNETQLAKKETAQK